MEVQEKETRYAELIKLFALVLNRYRLYPETHPAAQLAVRNFYTGLETVLQSEAAFTLGFVEGRMLGNDRSVDSKQPGVVEVVRECLRLQIESLTFARGVGEAELVSLFKLMSAPLRVLEGLGGFKAGVEQANFEHIRLGTSLFRLVRKGEEVVQKEPGDQKAGERQEQTAGAVRKIERMEELIQYCLRENGVEIDFDVERLSFEVEKKPEDVARQMLGLAGDVDGLGLIVTGVGDFLERRLARPLIDQGHDFSVPVARLAKEFRKAALGPEIPSEIRDSAEELARILERAADAIKVELVVKAFEDSGGDEKALARIAARFLRSREVREKLAGPLAARLSRLGVAWAIFDQALASLEEKRAPRRARAVEISAEELEELRQFKERFEKELGASAARRAVRLDEERQKVLDEIGAAMRGSAEPRIAANALLGKIDSFSPHGAASTVRVINRETSDFEALGCHNLNGGRPNGWQSAHSLARAVMESGAPTMIADLKSDPRAKDHDFVRKYGLVSYLGVPLMAKLNVGVLELFTKEEHDFSEEEIGQLATVADRAAAELHQSQVDHGLKKLADQLAKSNRVREEFLGIISHELRTPLSAIMAYAGMIRERVLGELNPRQEEALEKVMTRSGELLIMINTILEATSIEAGGVVVEIQEINLRGLIEELKASYETHLGKELTLVWDYPTDPVVLKSDRVKLKHILQNLIRNAIKFTDKGIITVSIRAVLESKKVEFEITDTGNGIPSDFVPWMFDLFRQVDSSGARCHGGLGLGLYIVKKYTEMLGGRVDVESDQGKGSVFTITLPLEAPAPQL